jgi:uncharacterized protein (TIGR00369 family)
MGELSADPPPGFAPFEPKGDFTRHNGPYLRHPDGTLAFFAEKRHCNGIGALHGGMLSSFLDTVLARAAVGDTGATPVTLHLSVDFLEMGRAGHWVLGEGRLTKRGGDLAFVEGWARMGGRNLARATGVFKVMRQPLE